jgi:hypothetical protein
MARGASATGPAIPASSAAEAADPQVPMENNLIYVK